MTDGDDKITFTTNNAEPPTDLQRARSSLMIAATELAICSLQQGVNMHRAIEDGSAGGQLDAAPMIETVEHLLQAARDFVRVKQGGEIEHLEPPSQRTPLVSVPLAPEAGSPDPRHDG
jgi:hypothetical protein